MRRIHSTHGYAGRTWHIGLLIGLEIISNGDLHHLGVADFVMTNAVLENVQTEFGVGPSATDAETIRPAIKPNDLIADEFGNFFSDENGSFFEI